MTTYKAVLCVDVNIEETVTNGEMSNPMIEFVPNGLI